MIKNYIIIYLLVFFLIFLLFNHKIDNLNIDYTFGPNIYSKLKVIIINFTNNNEYKMNKLYDNILYIHQYINYKLLFYKIINNKIIISYDDLNISKQIINIANNKFNNEQLNNILIKYKNTLLGPSTKSIIDYAIKRNIPYKRLNDDNLISLGWGIKQHFIEASTSSNTYAISESIAKNKELTKTMLKSVGIPIAEGYLVEIDNNYYNKFIKYFHLLNSPVVIKPYNGNHGNGVIVNIKSINELINGIEKIKDMSESIIIEKYIEGNDYRLLVINYKFIAASRRYPAFVIGDGINTIDELIKIINKTRGNGHETSLTKIIIDDDVHTNLLEQKLSLQTIPNINKIIYLRKNANLSTGGIAENVTDKVHSSIIDYAILASKQINLDICGIDIICKDISKSLEEQNGAFIEINSGPGLRMHLYPSFGLPINVNEPIIDMLFPNDNGRIPIIAITGTNGKTTIVNLISYIMKNIYKTVGKTTTNGVYINDFQIDEGDCTGPKSTQKILSNPDVEIAVLECARGGILKGLAFDYCDIRVITNIGNGDHIGKNYDCKNIDDLIKLKSVIIQNISDNGYAILNANDPSLYKILTYIKPTTKIIYFSIIKKEMKPIVYFDGLNIIYSNNNEEIIYNINDIPILEHLVNFQIENVLISIASCIAHDINHDIIKKGLSTFINDTNNNPGRFNIINYNKSKLIIDYGHNLDSINYICNFVNNKNYSNKIIMFGPAGDREDDVILNMLQNIKISFNIIIIFITSDTLRGRFQNDLLKLINKSFKNKNIEIIYNEQNAIDKCFKYLNENDICFFMVDNVDDSIKYIKNKISN
jgi:cyanophycin synthetase